MRPHASRAVWTASANYRLFVIDQRGKRPIDRMIWLFADDDGAMGTSAAGAIRPLGTGDCSGWSDHCCADEDSEKHGD